MGAIRTRLTTKAEGLEREAAGLILDADRALRNYDYAAAASALADATTLALELEGLAEMMDAAEEAG